MCNYLFQIIFKFFIVKFSVGIFISFVFMNSNEFLFLLHTIKRYN